MGFHNYWATFVSRSGQHSKCSINTVDVGFHTYWATFFSGSGQQVFRPHIASVVLIPWTHTPSLKQVLISLVNPLEPNCFCYVPTDSGTHKASNSMGTGAKGDRALN